MNKYILLYKNTFIDYHSIINNSKNVININIFILKIIEWENIKLLDKYSNFAIIQNILHISQFYNELLSLIYINIKQARVSKDIEACIPIFPLATKSNSICLYQITS